MAAPSSRGRGRGLRVALALISWLAFAERAHGFELRVWPLGEIARSEGATHTRLLGPFLEWRREGERRALAIRPLLTYATDSKLGESSGSFLYPLTSWSSAADEFSLRFLGVGSYVWRREPPVDRPYRRELTIVPFVFFRSGDAGTSFSLLPFYGNVEHLLGYERVRMVLFPLYLRLEEPRWRKTWLPFPFFSKVGGAAGEGTRLWPIYGHTRLGTDYEATYVAWPLYVRAAAHPGRADQMTSRISWPLFSTIDSPQLESRSYGFLPLVFLPLYTHTIDRTTNSEITGFPWPAWMHQDDLTTGARRSTRYTPIYERRETENLVSTFYGWPFYRHREGRGDDAGYERTDVLFVLYRDQVEGEAATRLHSRALLPLWISRDGVDSGDAQALTLLDGVFPKNETLRESWAPLYRLYGTERHGDETRHDVLWRMWVWGGGKLRAPWYLSTE